MCWQSPPSGTRPSNKIANGGRLNFHRRTILLPPKIIDYIVVHELVHLREPRHNAEFWSRVERIIPDYSLRKMWLLENGGKM